MALCAFLWAGCAQGEYQGGAAPDASAGADAPPIDFPDAAPESPDDNPGPADAAPVVPDAAPVTTTLRQSNSDTITSENSISCNNGTPNFFHQENRYFRVYNLPGAGIDGPFNVTNVLVGIEQARGSGGSQPANVRLHTLTGAAALANLTQIATTPITITDQTNSILDVPITATVPAGSQLVVEFQTPAGISAGHSLFIGSNTAGESTNSFIVAPATGCDITEMTNPNTLVANLNMHVVLKVTGSHNP